MGLLARIGICCLLLFGACFYLIDMIILGLVIPGMIMFFFHFEFQHFYNRMERIVSNYQLYEKDDQLHFSWLISFITSVGLLILGHNFLLMAISSVAWNLLCVAIIACGFKFAFDGCSELISDKFANFILQKFSAQFSESRQDQENTVVKDALFYLVLGTVLLSSLYFGGGLALALKISLLPLKIWFPVASAMIFALPAHYYIDSLIKRNQALTQDADSETQGSYQAITDQREDENPWPNSGLTSFTQ